MSAVARSAGLARLTRGARSSSPPWRWPSGSRSALLVVDERPRRRPRRVWAVFGPLVGWSFVGTGLYAWRRRPESRFGALMTLLGLRVVPQRRSRRRTSPLLFTVGIVLGALWGPAARARAAELPERAAGRRAASARS